MQVTVGIRSKPFVEISTCLKQLVNQMLTSMLTSLLT